MNATPRRRTAALLVGLATTLGAAALTASVATAAPTGVFAWGANGFASQAHGSLGDGSSVVSSLLPVRATGLTDAVAIGGGGFHSLAVKADGTVRAWGYNANGQLGDNTTTPRNTPTAVNNLTDVAAVAGGTYFSLALLADGTIRSWGANNNGQLGDTTTDQRLEPVAVSGVSGAVAVTAGTTYGLALLGDGTVRSWGSNWTGELGDGTSGQASVPTPVTVAGVSTATAVAAGGGHSLARLADGTIRAWGRNNWGQLGNGADSDLPGGTQVTGIATATAVASGYFHNLALLADGTVRAWGRNNWGQLGPTVSADHSKSPVAVPGLSDIVAVAAGNISSYALESDGTVWAWGAHAGGDSATPVAVAQLQADSISVGAQSPHILARAIPASVDADEVDFGTQARATLSDSRTVTVTNAGPTDLSILHLRKSGANPDDFLISGEDCTGEPLAGRATCTVRVRFAPSAEGARAATLAIRTDGALTAREVELTGTGGGLPQGPAGPAGPAGPTGPQGPNGLTGPTGGNGQQGATGSTGPAGKDGAAGRDGAPGARGPAGSAAGIKVSCRLVKQRTAVRCTVAGKAKAGRLRVSARLAGGSRRVTRSGAGAVTVTLHAGRRLRSGQRVVVTAGDRGGALATTRAAAR